jgi:hypothetical protein
MPKKGNKNRAGRKTSESSAGRKRKTAIPDLPAAEKNARKVRGGSLESTLRTVDKYNPFAYVRHALGGSAPGA